MTGHRKRVGREPNTDSWQYELNRMGIVLVLMWARPKLHKCVSQIGTNVLTDDFESVRLVWNLEIV